MRVETVRLLGERLPMTLVEIVAEDGTVGIGGADAPLSALRPILEYAPWNLTRLIRGRDPRECQLIHDELFRATLGQGGLAAHAQAALDMALWDLNAKLVGEPLHRLFGKQIQSRVMPYASATAFDLTDGLTFPLRFKSTDRLVSESKSRVGEGFRAIKFGWGNHFEPQDLERVAAIRSAIGPDVRLMLDFGGPDYFDPGVNPESAARITTLLEPYEIFFFEEPLSPYDADGFSALKQKSQTRIATGEMLCREWEFNRLIDARAVDVIQPDAYRIGITPMLAVARRAAEAGVLCVPHSPWSALAIAAHLQILATVSNGIMVEYPSPSLYTDTRFHGELIRLATSELVQTPMFPRDGYLEVPDRPGLGLGTFRPEIIKEMDALTERGLER
ncbi:MAG: mandelate racemase/muconate lactonizing enzyme family protein [Pirellulales bacterium]